MDPTEYYSLLDRDFFENMDNFFLNNLTDLDQETFLVLTNIPTDIISLTGYATLKNKRIVTNPSQYDINYAELLDIYCKDGIISVVSQRYDITRIQDDLFKLFETFSVLSSRVTIYNTFSNFLNNARHYKLSVLKFNSDYLLDTYSYYVDKVEVLNKENPSQNVFCLVCTLSITSREKLINLATNGIKEIKLLKPRFFGYTHDNVDYFLGYDKCNIKLSDATFGKNIVSFYDDCIIRKYSKSLWNEVVIPLLDIVKVIESDNWNLGSFSTFVEYWIGSIDNLSKQEVVEKVKHSVYSSLLEFDSKLIAYFN